MATGDLTKDWKRKNKPAGEKKSTKPHPWLKKEERGGRKKFTTNSQGKLAGSSRTETGGNYGSKRTERGGRRKNIFIIPSLGGGERGTGKRGVTRMACAVARM